MKGCKTSTRTPGTPKLIIQKLASLKRVSRPESIIKSPEVHPYLATILSANKPGKDSLRKQTEGHRGEKPGDS